MVHIDSRYYGGKKSGRNTVFRPHGHGASARTAPNQKRLSTWLIAVSQGTKDIMGTEALVSPAPAFHKVSGLVDNLFRNRGLSIKKIKTQNLFRIV